jgi:hypothetical protein
MRAIHTAVDQADVDAAGGCGLVLDCGATGRGR